MYLVPSRQPYIVKYGGARVKTVSQTAKQYSLTAETGDLENRVYSHALVVCIMGGAMWVRVAGWIEIPMVIVMMRRGIVSQPWIDKLEEMKERIMSRAGKVLHLKFIPTTSYQACWVHYPSGEA
ncbi:hypothetical protein SeLEV6574_g08243 [Synchytrium endobioticum]|uniref:Uncharacterized protein n=1 Tax=Synchytrium endobioticum TaxID=286115 RepID=A0A507CBK4_9FUNG|nr:hypothetical protein SeLEV6574_g08243 [Synchytrium endobioticum]